MLDVATLQILQHRDQRGAALGHRARRRAFAVSESAVTLCGCERVAVVYNDEQRYCATGLASRARVR